MCEQADSKKAKKHSLKIHCPVGTDTKPRLKHQTC